MLSAKIRKGVKLLISLSGYEPDELPDCSIPRQHVRQKCLSELAGI